MFHSYIQWGNFSSIIETTISFGITKGGATNLKVEGSVHWKVVGGGVVNTVRTLTFEKGGGCMTPPPAPMVAPPLGITVVNNRTLF